MSVVILKKKWDEGDGYVTVTFYPAINTPIKVTVTSDSNNLETRRSMTINFKDDSSGQILNSITVNQAGQTMYYSHAYSSAYKRCP